MNNILEFLKLYKFEIGIITLMVLELIPSIHLYIKIEKLKKEK